MSQGVAAVPVEPVELQISDDTFIALDPAGVAAVVADPGRWARWWPDLVLELTRDRGPKGCQWVLRGPIAGTAEIYLEPWQDGTVLHLYLRLRVPPETCSLVTPARSARLSRARTLAWKRTVTRLKDELEQGRLPGTASFPPIGHDQK